MTGNPSAYCIGCGKVIPARVAYCPLCGASQDRTSVPVEAVPPPGSPMAAPTWGQPAETSAPQPTVTKKGGRKVWKAIAAIVVVFFGLAALGAVTKAPSSPAQGDPARPAGPAAASDADRWAEFGAWVQGDMQSIAVDTTAISAAAREYDVVAAKLASTHLKATASRLVAYLASHPAASCYATVHASVLRAMDGYVAAGTAGSGGDFETGATEMERATGLINTATDELSAANAACAK